MQSGSVREGQDIKTYAFIFARGGSKGLPGKNTKKLRGKPLIEYSIEIAHKIPEIDDVFVSTDCNITANIAVKLGAKVIHRPADLASDESPEWLSWQHAVEYVYREYGDFTGFVSLPTTSPLRAEQDVRAALAKLHNSSLDICISLTPASRSPYFNMVKFRSDESVEILNAEKTNINRRQDAPKVYDITTVVYATTPEYIVRNRSMFAGRVGAIIVPKERAIDIDDFVDFICAEAILDSEQFNDG